MGFFKTMLLGGAMMWAFSKGHQAAHRCHDDEGYHHHFQAAAATTAAATAAAPATPLQRAASTADALAAQLRSEVEAAKRAFAEESEKRMQLEAALQAQRRAFYNATEDAVRRIGDRDSKIAELSHRVAVTEATLKYHLEGATAAKPSQSVAINNSTAASTTTAKPTKGGRNVAKWIIVATIGAAGAVVAMKAIRLAYLRHRRAEKERAVAEACDSTSARRRALPPSATTVASVYTPVEVQPGQYYTCVYIDGVPTLIPAQVPMAQGYIPTGSPMAAAAAAAPSVPVASSAVNKKESQVVVVA